MKKTKLKQVRKQKRKEAGIGNLSDQKRAARPKPF